MINSMLSSIKSLAEPVSWAILHSLWQGALVVAVLTIALIVLRKKNPNIRYAVSCLALAVVFAMFIGTVFYLNSENKTVTNYTDVHNSNNIIPADSEFDNSETGIMPATQLVKTNPTILHKLESYIPQIFQFWMLGMLMFSIYHIIGWKKTRRLTKAGTEQLPQKWQHRISNLCYQLGIKHQVHIVKSSLVHLPCVIGWIKPVVLIPMQVLSGLSDDQLEMIIIHELAHIRRLDCLVNYLQAATETLMYFNPAVWWISKQIHTERELCCDDLAVKVSGNKLLYAKALMNLEEMRHVEPAFAMGINGSSSLLQRIQRLGGQSMQRYGRFSIFKLTGVVALVFMLTLGLGSINGYTEPDQIAYSSSDDNTYKQNSNGDIVGSWEMKRDGDQLRLRLKFKREGYTTTFGFHDEDFKDLFQEKNGVYTIVRDAGTFYLDGDIDLNDRRYEGSGDCRFKGNPKYETELKSMGYEVESAGGIMSMAIHEIDIKFVRGIHAADYKDVTLDNIIEFHIHDVTPEYIANLKAVGQENIPADHIVEMSIHDVDPEYVMKFKEMGYDDLDFEDLIQMSIHDVEPDYIKSFEEAGYEDIDVEGLIQMSIHDVDPDYIKAFETVGLDDIDVDELIQMSIHDVDPDYILAINELGYDDVDVEGLIQMSIHDVDLDYIKTFELLGLEEIDVDELIQMSIHDVDPENIRTLELLGLKEIDTEDLIQMSIHDIEPEYIKGLADLGYTDLEPEELVSMRIHDVTPEFIRELQRREFKNLTPERLIRIKLHDLY